MAAAFSDAASAAPSSLVLGTSACPSAGAGALRLSRLDHERLRAALHGLGYAWRTSGARSRRRLAPLSPEDISTAMENHRHGGFPFHTW